MTKEYARDFLRKKEKMVLSNTARQVIRIAIEALEEQINKEVKKDEKNLCSK